MAAADKIMQPREYQLEMLNDSLQRNIIVAMDTGSGKTNIAILRIATELERCGPLKRVWFLCPTVSLAQQQHKAISGHLPAFQSLLLSGNDGVDHWSTQSIWDRVLHNVSIVVCTHQVLLDTLIHGFVRLASIALLVFDEAHHCNAAHPANRIMKEFYHPLKAIGNQSIPSILGLTASPIMNKKGGGLQAIEQNLDSISRTPKVHREELMEYVHLPEMSSLAYSEAVDSVPPSLTGIVNMLDEFEKNTMNDPCVVHLPSQKPQTSDTYKTIRKAPLGNTYCQEQMRRLVAKADNVHAELGGWASDRYIKLCVSRFQTRQSLGFDDVAKKQSKYLSNGFSRFVPLNESDANPITSSISSKTKMLIDLLSTEMIKPGSAGIVFVKTRAVVQLLFLLLSTNARTKDALRIGTFVGTSNNQNRASNISDIIDATGQSETLDDLRTGVKNLIISTSICEEGIDISACNIVVCFEEPPNLKSFIQRRGRARSAHSRYIIMFPRSAGSKLDEWSKLEQEMKNLYMDETRTVSEIIDTESDESGNRELLIENTGAKLTLDDSVRHLYHFCSKLPISPYTMPTPLFGFSETDEGAVSCRVYLPNSVDVSVREFCSSKSWKKEKLARCDASFEACIGLHKAGLIDDHLMPLGTVDEEALRAYEELEKRPNTLSVDGQVDPWTQIASKWQEIPEVYAHAATVTFSSGEELRMELLLPLALTNVQDTLLYVDSAITAHVNIGVASQPTTTDNIELANKITQLLLTAAHQSRTDPHRSGFPVLVIPLQLSQSPQSWYEGVCGTFDAKDVLLLESSEPIGLVRDLSQTGTAFEFLGTEMCSDENDQYAGTPVLKIRARRLPKRTDFLHPLHPDAKTRTSKFCLLDPETCTIDRLPARYAWFAKLLPSVLHHIRNTLVTEELCSTVLKDVGFADRALVTTAISAPVAREGSNYQRLEFLGDSCLKMQTSLGLMSEHPLWHEGYLSRAKDHIVSNGNLSVSAQRCTLARYILAKPFTGLKWRPVYNDDLLNQPHPDSRELSTKVLADVVEALLGAAFLDGGEPRLNRCLSALLPRTNWTLSMESFEELRRTASLCPEMSLAEQYKPLEILIGYKFSHKSLLLEAVTHPSYLSSSSISSYQRLEYLGDAILDSIVTKQIYSHNSEKSVPKMHLYRTAAVNGNFLAFLAMAHTTAIDRIEIAEPSTKYGHKLVPSLSYLSLPSFLRVSASLELQLAMRKTKERFNLRRDDITNKLATGRSYPWVELESFSPEKVFSDLVESTLGAIAIDSGGNMEACEQWLERLGVLPWLRHSLAREVELLHPKERLGIAADTASVRYDTKLVRDPKAADTSQTGPSLHQCTVFVADEEIYVSTGITKKEVEAKAANGALDVMNREKSRREQVRAVEAAGDGEGSDSDQDVFYDAEMTGT